MKYYETHFEEYVSAVSKYNLHTELTQQIKEIFENHHMKTSPPFSFFPINLIVYGPSGVGKYSQVLNILKNYSPSSLKYEKKITVSIEKQTYIYNISDIHYEIDMELLGCNTKMFFYEIFLQIVDIISVKKEKYGIIVCKNFHLIHNELLDIFYSYMQNNFQPYMNIKLHFVLITENISFIPNKILNNCKILAVPKPSKEKLLNMCISNNIILNKNTKNKNKININRFFVNNNDDETMLFFGKKNETLQNNNLELVEKEINNAKQQNLFDNIHKILNDVQSENLRNNKEIYYFLHMKEPNELPKDNFNIVCDNIIQEITFFKTKKTSSLSLTNYRDLFYDILIYNLNVTECVWYVFLHFLNNDNLNEKKITNIFQNIFTCLKRLNNNYRSIFHIEKLFLKMMQEILFV